MEITNELLIKLYTNLVRTRKFDEAAVKWLAGGRLLSFYHPALGGEAPGVGGSTILRKDDIISPHLRGHGLPHLIGKGGDPKSYMAEHCGRITGGGNGLGGVHAAYDEIGIFGGSGTLGQGFVLSCGWGLACKKNGQGQVCVCFFGDGTANRGQYHEAANLCALWKLPVVFVCENNGIAQYVRLKDSYPLDDLANLAAGYGMPAAIVDGQDVVAVAEAVGVAVERAREGKGPSFVECKTSRFFSHGVGNPEPRTEEEIAKAKERDPLEVMEKRLLEQGVLTEDDFARIKAEADAEVAEAEEFIDESPFPDDPALLDAAVYAD